MDYALILLIFALILAVITLRFGAIVNQLVTRMSSDRAELVRELDHSHTQSFNNAMTALESVQQRVVDSQVAMFNKTVDMVHGPVQVNDDAPKTEDDYKADMVPPWEGDNLLWADPTDGLMPDPPLEPQDNEHRAVSVRPGEGLVPHG